MNYEAEALTDKFVIVKQRQLTDRQLQEETGKSAVSQTEKPSERIHRIFVGIGGTVIIIPGIFLKSTWCLHRTFGCCAV